MAEVESYDSSKYPSSWGGGKLEVTRVPWSVDA